MEYAKAHLFIDGMVQGVFYRAFTRDLANNLGLNGWVRNLHDGRVEVVFEGEKGLIEKAVKVCYIGPSGARVSDIDVKWETFVGDQKGFRISFVSF
jgi:acylphosphatase